MKRIIAITGFIIGALLLCQAGMALADDMVGGGDIHYTEPVVGVIFSHEFHVEEAGMDCDSCHEEPFEMEALAAQEQPDFNMLSLAEGRYCGVCHDGETAFSSNTRCASCHEGVLGYNRALGMDTEDQGH